MWNSLRCCLACVLPCGVLDLIRIVHLNGYVEEIRGPITAGEVLDANPNHILSKPCAEGMVRRILILSPESYLKRGSIYFLIPKASLPLPETKKGRLRGGTVDDNKSSTSTHLQSGNSVMCPAVYEKKSSRRSDQVSEAWHPDLQSISEEWFSPRRMTLFSLFPWILVLYLLLAASVCIVISNNGRFGWGKNSWNSIHF